ncbi:transporter [Bacteroides sedimenti]|uniref:Transporter n=2 Tax=Bacteroides sedimenti TaxID=2136147 RepID=A0ABM8IBV2_9BACE
MITGAIGYQFFSLLAPFTPFLIFTMLLLTFCKVSPRELRFEKLHFWLIALQLIGSLLIYFSIAGFNSDVAEGAMICMLAPTATSAAVITGMLGGSVSCLTTYTLLSNVVVALSAPVIFSLMGNNSTMPFFSSFFYICKQVFPVLILPFICAWFIQAKLPKIHSKVLSMPMASFYLWTVALAIVVGKTVAFLVNQKSTNYTNEILVAASGLVICCLQFFLGKSIGGHFKNRISGGQALGQKNTILAIWMAQVYLNPIASVGPASYVLWQNTINSWQLWKKRKKDEAASQRQ